MDDYTVEFGMYFFGVGARYFLFSASYGLDLRLNQPPIQ
jgi:hypothetical protein